LLSLSNYLVLKKNGRLTFIKNNIMKKISNFLLAIGFIVISGQKLNAQCVSNAIQLDGVDEYMYTPFADYDFSNFTLECWINSADISANVHYISLYQNSYLVLGDWDSNDFSTWADGLSPIAVNSPPQISINTWVHVAFVYDGSNQIIYVNGVVTSTVATTGVVTVNPSFNSGLVIGARYTTSTQFTNSQFGEVRIWNVARTQSEIQNNMSAVLSGSELGLLAYYTFQDGTGSSIVTDHTANNHDLTLFNMEPNSDWVTTPSVSYATDVHTACDSLVWIDGNTYTSSNNTATHILVNAVGCDSIVTLDLTVNNATSGVDVQTACGSYDWIDGNTYTVSNNTATHTLMNAVGCDSVVTLDLTINTVSDITVANLGLTLTANNNNATYQWVDCNNNNAIISGETNQTYTPIVNGNYAVQLTENGCVDTSLCASIVSIGIIENNFEKELLIFPNPTFGDFSVDLGETRQNISVSIFDLDGKLIQSKKFVNTQQLKLSINEPAGVYLLNIESDDKKAVVRLIKK